MEYTIEQIQRGTAKYIDSEFTRRITGLNKWAFGALASMAICHLGDIANVLKQNQIASMLGVFKESGAVDVDTLYTYFKAEADKGTVTIDVPLIGATTLSASDVDKLYACIKQG